jgi:hypothetical protein
MASLWFLNIARFAVSGNRLLFKLKVFQTQCFQIALNYALYLIFISYGH